MVHSRFLELNFQQLSEELPIVRDYLVSFPPELQAIEGYQAVRGFLKSYAGNEPTFNFYRTHVERLLLWSLLIARKPLLELRRRDAEAFMEFCLRPPRDWTGPMVRSRFVRIGGRRKLESDRYVVNEAWRPFSMILPKRNRALADQASDQDVDSRPYRMSQGSVTQVFAVCGSFFQHAIDEGLTEVNPFRAVKQKSIEGQGRGTEHTASGS